MASIDKRPGPKDKNGKSSVRWRARWREYPGGPQKSQHFDRKVDAENHLKDVNGALRGGTYVDPKAGRMTFREWAETWRSIQVHRPSTARLVESQFRNHVYPVIGDRPLDSIRRSDIQALVKRLGMALAPSTVETVYSHVRTVFRAAVSDRMIASTPCEKVRLPKVEKAEVTPLEVAMVKAIERAAPDRYGALVVLAAGTGMRQGECFGLTVDRVDFLRKRIIVDRQLDPGGSGKFAPPKTEASTRTVPLPEVVGQALAAHLAQFPADSDQLVFTNAQGRHLRRSSFIEMFGKASAEAKAPESTTFHDLRHFYASLLIRHGESVKVVQARLGHASAAETLDTYSHLWPDSEDQTRSAVDSVLGAEDSLRTEKAH